MGIYKRKLPSGNISWTVDYVDDGGKRRRLSFKTKKEAQQKIDILNAIRIKNDLENGNLIDLNSGISESAEKEINRIIDSMFAKNPDKRQVGRRLRMAILKRDGERCKVCGKNGDARLEIDHILAYSLGGKTTAGNLRTLCHECNSGKSNIFN